MGLFSKRSVESIMAPLTRIVDELNDHADEHVGKANVHEVKAAEHKEHAKAAWSEHGKARTQAGKLAGFIG